MLFVTFLKVTNLIKPFYLFFKTHPELLRPLLYQSEGILWDRGSSRLHKTVCNPVEDHDVGVYSNNYCT